MNFRIIAIKTGRRVESNYDPYDGQFFSDPLRVLSEDQIYKLYNNYSFPQGGFNNIKYDNGADMSLYNIQLADHKIEVNINAIVGSNGSGKSTLMELLYAANYNIGCQLGLLTVGENTLLQPSEMVDLEILYSIPGGIFYALKFKDRKIHQKKGQLKGDTIHFKGSYRRVTNASSLRDYFYTIAINYSHYALNSRETGEWITQLFHKNDGYQTPVVLNPMRTQGIIDINSEKHLLNRRLIANLLEEVPENQELVDSLRNLANGKIAKGLRIRFNQDWNKKIDSNSLKDTFTHAQLNSLKKALQVHFDIGTSMNDNNSYINETILSYIYSKLIKISKNYQPFYKYRYGKTIKKLNEFLKHIKFSNSHIVFKLKGAILFLKYQSKLLNGQKLTTHGAINLNIDYFSSVITEIKNKEPFWVNTFMMSPPSFFNIEIIPEDGLSFNAFSSGEKQKMHSISSIVYHLINLNSVESINEKQNENWLSYKYVNIILDEIELYYHPEWQRRYINDLISYIEKISYKNLENIKGINFIFLTHSPFILSDIPSNNILFLQRNGKPQVNDLQVKTFGANIHDLLKHSFFFDTGAIGEFAKIKITETIQFINQQKALRQNYSAYEVQGQHEFLDGTTDVAISRDSESLYAYYKNIIGIIDEPILKRKLSEMFDDISGENLELSIIQKKIKQLQAEAEKLKTKN